MRIPAFVLFCWFSLPAFADLTQTVTLQAGTYLNLDTGATTTSAPSGGAVFDILWNNGVTPQGSATAVVIGDIPFSIVSRAILTPLTYSAATIKVSDLTVSTVFAVKTNQVRYAKVLVTARSGTSMTIQFTTFGAPASSSGTPTITGVFNNSSVIPDGFSNSGIAPSSIFVVKGGGLADAGSPVLQSSASPGIQTTLNGASISVTVGGVTVQPALYYTSPGQLAAVLPANTPVGTGTLTVTHNGQASAPFTIKVVQSALGFNTYNANTAVATDAVTYALLSYAAPGKPGQTIVLWATGLGSDPADSDSVYTTTPHAVATPLDIYIGGIKAQVLYGGSAGYPGVTQINVVIPTNVATGCWISVAGVTNGTTLSNVATLPISANGGPCQDSTITASGTQLSQTTLKTGLVSVVQTNDLSVTPTEVLVGANGAFQTYTNLSPYGGGSVSVGSCIINETTEAPAVTLSGLAAGALTTTTPASQTLNMTSLTKGVYIAQLATDAIPASGGNFTVRGNGGADVGPFSTTVSFPANPFRWTNPGAAADVDKRQGLTVTWTGGDTNGWVGITGTAGSHSIVAGFTCIARVDAGQFTVPAHILLVLPDASGAVNVQNTTFSSFTASGIDVGMAVGEVSYGADSFFHSK